MSEQAKLQAHINALNAEIKAKSEKLEAVKAELKYALRLPTIHSHLFTGYFMLYHLHTS